MMPESVTCKAKGGARRARRHAARRPLVQAASLSVLFAVATAAPLTARQGTVPTPDALPHPANEAGIRRLLAERVESSAATCITAVLLVSGTAGMVAEGRCGNAAATVDSPLRVVHQLGSISKVFTAVLLAEMAARGEVALDDPVSLHLPPHVRVPEYEGREITLVDLATQTSGLPRLPSNLRPQDIRDPYAAYTLAELYEFLAAHELRRAPASEYEYSNLGPTLLGHVLALRAGVDYETLVIERVLEPLGMHDTRVTLGDGQRARLADGHRPDGETVRAWDFGIFAPAGGWYSTAQDMLRFVAALDGALLGDADGPLARVLRETARPQRDARDGMRIGLAWHVLPLEDRNIIMHNGQTGGAYAFAGLDPARRIGLVLLANGLASMDDLALRLLGMQHR